MNKQNQKKVNAVPQQQKTEIVRWLPADIPYLLGLNQIRGKAIELRALVLESDQDMRSSSVPSQVWEFQGHCDIGDNVNK